MPCAIDFRRAAAQYLASRGLTPEDERVILGTGLTRQYWRRLWAYHTPRLGTVDQIARGWDVAVGDLLCGPGLAQYRRYTGGPDVRQRAKAAAAARGLSMPQVATAMAISRQALNRILRRNNLQLSVLARLAVALGCGPKELLP